LRDLYDDWFLRPRRSTLCRSHVLLIVSLSPLLLIDENGLIGGQLFGNVNAAVKLFQHQQSTTGDSPINWT